MAVAAWQAARLPDDLLSCASGSSWPRSASSPTCEIAAQHDVSEVVPVLVGESFRDAATTCRRAPGSRVDC